MDSFLEFDRQTVREPLFQSLKTQTADDDDAVAAADEYFLVVVKVAKLLTEVDTIKREIIGVFALSVIQFQAVISGKRRNSAVFIL